MDPDSLLPARAVAPSARRAETLARAAGVVPSALTRGFACHVGIPPKRYLGALRLPLDLAPSRLDALVRAHPGLTPGEWRRQGEGGRHALGRPSDGAWTAGAAAHAPRARRRRLRAHVEDPEAVATALASPWPGAHLRADPGARRTPAHRSPGNVFPGAGMDGSPGPAGRRSLRRAGQDARAPGGGEGGLAGGGANPLA
jgi:AraC-like DNA-binding protein